MMTSLFIENTNRIVIIPAHKYKKRGLLFKRILLFLLLQILAGGHLLAQVKSEGDSQANIIITPNFVPGTVTSSQTINYGDTPYTLYSEPATGGDGVFSYQWQMSYDNLNWTNIPGVTGLNYSPSATTQLTYFRVGTTSHALTAYSNVVFVDVHPQVHSGVVSVFFSNVSSGGGRVILDATPSTGGVGDFTYQWQKSVDGGRFLGVSSGNSTDGPLRYTDMGVTATTTFRLLSWDSDVAEVLSNEVVVVVSPTIIPGGISPAVSNVTFNTTPNMLTCAPATGGVGTYTYQWQSSPDNVIWTDISGETSLTHLPASTPGITYYRVMVTSGNATKASASAKVTILAKLVVGAITPASQIIFQGGLAATFTCTTPTGASGNYVYQWQASDDNLVWADVTGATGLTYNPGALNANKYYRLKVTDSGVIDYSNIATVIIGNCIALNSNPNTDMNYVITDQFLTTGIKSASLSEVAAMKTCEVSQVIQYIDGLGRPMQTVQVKGSPLGADVVQPVVYDQFGRQSTKYLPYTLQTGTSDGSYKTNSITAQSSFYTTPPTGVSAVSSPYAVTVFEPSPLNRVTEQGAPGSAWQPVAGSSLGHTGKMTYSANNITALTDTANSTLAVQYSVSAINATTQQRTLVKIGNYAAGQLYLSINRDENWKIGRGGTTEEYKDKEGRIVLKRTFNYKPAQTTPVVAAKLEILSTYYVYDDFGNLAYVLPPIANPDAGLTTAANQTTLDNLCYQYRYDDRNRLTQKRIPGKDWEFTVYNKLDQVVATQDAIQRGKTTPEWAVTRYDALGRVIISGLYSYGATSADVRAALQTTANNQTTLWETPTGLAANNGYTTASFPGTISTTLLVNYYDDYRFAGTNPYLYANGSTMTKGLPTGSLTNVLGTSNMLWSESYYDDFGRNVKTFKQHYLGGVVSPLNYDEIGTGYSFTDQVKSIERKHWVKSGSATILAVTVTNSYEYDAMGRKVKTYEQIITTANTGNNILLAKNDYNETGQLMAKYLHGATGGAPFLQNIDYTYNERGWLSMINNPANLPTAAKLFSEQLNYNAPQYSAPAQFNGNIAEQAYRIFGSPNTGVQTVKYAYDQVNRLTGGTSSSGYSETGISYDVAGNINTLVRATAPNPATLNYFYTGNQLATVKNGATAIRNYLYDLNGNATSDGLGNTIIYNMFNLPQTVTAKNLAYTYDATGNKLRKVSGGTTTEYIGGIQYTGTTIDFIQTEEGRAINSAGTYKYEYTLTDHLGNNRVTFDQTNGKVGENDYYPFGLNVTVGSPMSPVNKYLYNKKELQDELGQYDYGARFYDPVIARWTSVDPLAEKMRRFSPYVYGGNSPVRFIDPDGMLFKPTPQEAAAIANHVYGGVSDETLIGGWRKSNAENNIAYNNSNNGLQSALYERTDKKTGKIEYVYATAGTDPTSPKDLISDVLQLFGKSGQYADAVDNGKKISSDLSDSELTFVGHSLGGGEAAASALATGRDAITFNAAGLSDATKSSLQLNKAAKIDNYDVDGQIVKGQQIIGVSPSGTQHALAPGIQSPSIIINNPTAPILSFGIESVLRHLMGAVNEGMKK